MAFLKRICMVIMLMLLRSYNAESNMEDSHFSHKHPSIKKLIEPLSYDIRLHLPFKRDHHIFDGANAYFFVIENPTQKIDLNVRGLTIIVRGLHFDRFPYIDHYYPESNYYSNETETLTFDFETDVPSGLYYTFLKFRGNISEKEIGVYRTSCKDCNGASKWIFTTQLYPTAARRVFPCWDEPSLRARFAITIEDHPDYTVLSNMPVLKQWGPYVDVMVTQFDSTPPIPTYLVAFSLTGFVCNDRKADGFTTRVCCRPSVKHQIIFALNTSVNVMSYLQQYMDISPQLSEITHIGLPDFPYNATGNWGLNIYRESHIIYNETLHSIDHKLDVSTYVASMVAHQWFGNLVSPTSWTNMWFFQTLALFYGAKAVTETYPDEDIKFMFTYRLQSLAREDDVVSQMKPVMYAANTRDEIDKLIKLYHFNNYLKEYAIMVLLEDALTENIFRNAAVKYLEKHQFSSATPNDFWKIIQDDKRVLYFRTSILKIVQSWLEQRSLPVMHLISVGKYVNIKKDNYNNNNLAIPVNYVTKSHPASVSRITWMDQYKYMLIDIPISDWVIVNWQRAGYYRVRYDALTWETLTNYLFSEDYTKIHVLSRAHIIEDAHYFWSQKELHITRFINLIKCMDREKQCAPWYVLQKVLQKMWTFLNTKAGGVFKYRILVSLNLLLEELGYTEHPNDVECVKFKRLLATKWACRFCHGGCLEIAKERLIEHLDHPETHIIPPMWEEWTYCNGLVRSDMDTWVNVFKEFMETENMRILEYLSCSENSTIIIHYLELLKSYGPSQPDLGVNEIIRQKIYRSTLEKHIWRKKVFYYILRTIIDLTKMKVKKTSSLEELVFIIGIVYWKEQMNEIKSLLEKDFDTNSAYYRDWLRPIIEHQFSQIQKLNQSEN